MIDLLLNPHLGFLSIPILGPETAGSFTMGYWCTFIQMRAKKQKKIPRGWDAQKFLCITTAQLYNVKITKTR